MINNILRLMIASLIIDKGFCIWCYECAPSLPGCNDPYNWRGMGYLGTQCTEADDRCVKLIEIKGAERVVTRSCLSNIEPYRTDVPADRYEGCRPASPDPRLAHYVVNSVRELDVKRDNFDETIWCFCYLDHRCNGSISVHMPTFLYYLLIIAWYML